MASTSQKDKIRPDFFPCIFTFQTGDPTGELVTYVHDIFGKICPKDVKIVKELYSKLTLKEGRRIPVEKCRWTIIYCPDDDAQLSTEQIIHEIRMAKPQCTTILKEVHYYVNMRLYIAVDYLMTTAMCRHYPSTTGANSRSKVPEHYKNGDSDRLCSLTDSTRLEAIEFIVNNIQHPVKKMCLMLDFIPWRTDLVDNWLVEAFQGCLPEHFDLLARYETQIRLSMSYPRDEEYPTLLHFAARFGLEKFVFQILERPGSAIACHIKNKYDMTPAESAESDERLELAMMIKRYTNLDQFCKIYSELREISLKSLKMNDDNISSEVFKDLDRVRFPLDYFYKSTLSSVQPQSLEPKIQEDSGCANSDDLAPIELPSNSGQSQASRINRIDEYSKDFLKIITGFNRTIAESAGADLLKLVEDWNNRNNVEKSFKKKKEQLKEMSLRYEKIEMEIENSMKKAMIFDVANTLLEMIQTQYESEISSPSVGYMHSQKPVVNTWYSSKSSGIARIFMEASATCLNNEELKDTSLNHDEDNFETMALEKNRTPVSAPDPVKTEVFTNKSELFETVKENPMATPDTLFVKKESGTHLPPSDPLGSGNEANYQEYVTLDADKTEANHDICEASDDKNEANDDMNEAIDDMNEVIDDMNEVIDDINEATHDNDETIEDKDEANDDMNEATHYKNEATDSKNETIEDKNKANDDMNEAKDDLNEVTHDKDEITNDKNKTNDNMNEATHDENEATDDMNKPIDDMNEAAHDKNEAIDDMNEASHDKNEATGVKNETIEDKNKANDDMNEAKDDLNEVTHDKDEITNDKNEANDNMNEAIDDTNEATHDKNEATDDNRVENTSCTIS